MSFLTAACGHPVDCIQTHQGDDSLCCRWCMEVKNLKFIIEVERERADLAEALLRDLL